MHSAKKRLTETNVLSLSVAREQALRHINKLKQMLHVVERYNC